GAPIYSDGKVIGALAYSWQSPKEPVAGITPIDEMLKSAQAGQSGGDVMPAAAPRMSGGEFLAAIANHSTDKIFEKLVGSLGETAMSAAMTKPIAGPLSMSSLAREPIRRYPKPRDA